MSRPVAYGDGHDQASEDLLLAGSGWEEDGDARFTIATWAGSSWRGVFGPLGESRSLHPAGPRWVPAPSR